MAIPTGKVIEECAKCNDEDDDERLKHGAKVINIF